MNNPYHLTGCVVIFALPGLAHGVELVGEKLELYGKAHLSLDVGDADVSGEDTQLSVSNNSTRLGFKGKHDLNARATLLWQYEQGVDIAESGGELASRNSYLGARGSLGELRVGHHDTPSKSLGSDWGMFSDTVGDRRAILGAYSGYGNVLNDRADNAVLYLNRFNALELQLMYSASNPSTSTTSGLDDNDFELSSLSLSYRTDNLTLGGSAEQWSLDPVKATEEVCNLRLTAAYRMAPFTVGAIYEVTDSDDEVFNRNAFGLNAAYQITAATDVRLQTLFAGDNDVEGDTGAAQYAVGLFSRLDPATEVYAAYSATDNDSNALYQGIDGGHGDELETTAGGNPMSFSVGAVYKF